MAKFRCTVCNYIYDEEKEGKKFSAFPLNWVCPVCSAPKSAFEEVGTAACGSDKEAEQDKIHNHKTRGDGSVHGIRSRETHW
jgi:rubredoxin